MRWGRCFEKEPIIVIDDKCGFWLSDSAHEFISRKNIPFQDFSEWLMAGASHLDGLSYGDVKVQPIGLIGNYFVAHLRHLSEEDPHHEIKLTEKEKEVLSFLVKGLSNKEISGLMHIKPGTVNSHLDSIYQKLHCSNRLSACLTAFKLGFVVPPIENC